MSPAPGDVPSLEVRPEGTARVLRISGAGSFTEVFRKTLFDAVSASKIAILDLSDLEHLRWEDLGTLVSARRMHRERWGVHMHHFKVVARPGPVRAMIAELQLEHILGVYRSIAEATSTLPSRRALHVEEDDEVASLVEILLESNGYEVLRFRSPEAADRASVGSVDVILTEVRFGGAEDLDLPRRLRVEFGVPVIVLASRAEPEAHSVAGAAWWEAKPMVPGRILARVQSSLESPLRDYYETILDLLPAPILIAPVSEGPAHANRAWIRRFGLSPSGSGPLDLRGAFPEKTAGRDEILEEILRVGRIGARSARTVEVGGEATHLEIEGVHLRGERPHVLLCASPRASAGEAGDDAAHRGALLSILEDLDAARCDLERSNQRLSALDHLKDEFLANVSHELRTPLTAIKASVENLAEGFLGEVSLPQRRTLELVRRNTTRLTRLIEHLLDLSSLESGTLSLRRKVFDIREPLRQALEEVWPIAERGALRKRVDLPPDAVLVAIDEDRIEQVIVNLLDNALRFARSEIALSAEVRGGDVRIMVEDDGPGIAPADRERIFDRFSRTQEHAAKSRTGIGLSIARGMVEAHGGKIWVENREPPAGAPEGSRGGARFVFLLPLAKAEATTAAVAS